MAFNFPLDQQTVCVVFVMSTLSAVCATGYE